MNKPRVLLLPLNSRDYGALNYSTRMFDRTYHTDSVHRLELTLEDCECIVANLPTVLEFIVWERVEAGIGPDGMPIRDTPVTRDPEPRPSLTQPRATGTAGNGGMLRSGS